MCNFCDDYRELKLYEKKSFDRHNADPEADMQMRVYYRLTLKSVIKRRKKNTKRWYDGGSTRHGSYRIIYCPECGRKLER